MVLRGGRGCFSQSVTQQHQLEQSQGQRTKRPAWTVEEEVKLVNHVCCNYELLSNNKKLFWREFGKNSGQILHYPRSADSCKNKFYALVARYHQNVDLYDAIERYLDLEEGLVSTRHVPLLQHVSRDLQSIEEQESLSNTSTNSTIRDECDEETTSFSIQQSDSLQQTTTTTEPLANTLLSKPPHDKTQPISPQVVVPSVETNIAPGLDSREISSVSSSTSPPFNPFDIFKDDDLRISGITLPTNNPENAPTNTSQTAYNYNASSSTSSTSDPSISYNDFPSFIENIRHQIFAAQDYLNEKRSRTEDHLNSLDAVLHLFTQLEDQFQKMSIEEL